MTMTIEAPTKRPQIGDTRPARRPQIGDTLTPLSAHKGAATYRPAHGRTHQGTTHRPANPLVRPAKAPWEPPAPVLFWAPRLFVSAGPLGQADAHWGLDYGTLYTPPADAAPAAPTRSIRSRLRRS